MKKIIFIIVTLISLSITAQTADPPTIVQIDKDGVQRVSIIGGDYFFKPSHIVVKVHVPVELMVSKETYIVPHSIVIDAPEAGIMVNESLSRDPKHIVFTPVKTGIFPIFCDKKPPFLASHREKGMEGMLEVVE